MIKEGVLKKFKPEVIFSFHTWAPLNAGMIGFRSGPMMASYDNFKIIIRGRQTHASRPWGGVDPIVISAQVILAIQTIASRQVNVTLAPSIVSIGSIHGGIRNNIIPDEVEMLGTVRAFDADMRLDIFDRLKKTVMATAEAGGATAEVEFDYGYPVTINDPDLTAKAMLLLRETLGDENVHHIDLVTGAEDFSYFQNEIPGFYFFLGATPRGEDASKAPSNHSPLFYVDESTLLTGLQAILALTINYLEDGG